MSAPSPISWYAANQRYLMARVALVRQAVAQFGKPGDENQRLQAQRQVDEAARALPFPPALDTLSTAFGLSEFERDVLLLCAGMELDSEFAQSTAAQERSFPTFSLALAVFPDAHWSALAPAAALRRWRLIEIGLGDALVTSPLRIDERILHYLTGVSYLDTRLQDFVERVQAPKQLPPSQEAVAQRVSQFWAKSQNSGEWPAIQLCGEDSAGIRDVAAFAAAKLGGQLHAVRASNLPAAVPEREALSRLWQREAILSGSAILVECEAAEQTRAAVAFAEKLEGMLLLSAREPVAWERRLCIRLDVSKPSVSEQQSLWLDALPSFAPRLNGHLDTLVSQFNLGSRAIRSAGVQVAEAVARDPDTDLGSTVWDACRVQTRQRLDELAQRIEPVAGWQDLVLPEAQMNTLHDIASQVRQRAKVYHAWGFASKSSRGLGLSSLFAGPSGSGKTMAAEVLAKDLRLDLFRIDLSQVVSKYIGETEKNLRRVFDAAEESGAVLLFDEADALFGKRSEVKDSHDRYANIEVSYLLQRMEAYAGLAVLTTNLKNVLDPAFLRRIRFVVQFPFPDAEHRAAIWRRIFPAETPVEGLDFARLARLNVTGGNIRNIALNAAFLAADTGGPVRMPHLLRAARTEYAKLEKPLSDAEVVGWV